MNNLISKSRRFGRINFQGTQDKRFHAVSLELRIEKKTAHDTQLNVDLEPVNGDYLTVSICGNIGTQSCGQCLDTVADIYPKCQPDADDLPTVLRICELWEAHHLNDMNAGSRVQQACLDAAKRQHERYSGQEGPAYPSGDHYGWANDILESCGMLVDRGYKYGHAWLVTEVPIDVVMELCELFGVDDTSKLDEFKPAQDEDPSVIVFTHDDGRPS